MANGFDPEMKSGGSMVDADLLKKLLDLLKGSGYVGGDLNTPAPGSPLSLNFEGGGVGGVTPPSGGGGGGGGGGGAGGGGTPACVVSSCLITLPDLTKETAKKLRVGDKVLSFRKDGALVPEKIRAVKVSVQPCYRFELGEPYYSFTCSHSHLFLCLKKGKMVKTPASKVEEGMFIMAPDMTKVLVIRREDVGKMEVVCIDLEGPNNIYIAQDLLAHNKDEIPGVE